MGIFGICENYLKGGWLFGVCEDYLMGEWIFGICEDYLMAGGYLVYVRII